ncbi:MAG: hypothetical protein KDE33_16950 [Bacteroidetes bacterium]|nr:hypothetical protein [Bacteroidota bacterium]
MVQIFLKPSSIEQADWERAYQGIKSIVTAFPTKIIRLESYYGYEKKLDKKHFDLIVEENTSLEHISFWGDWMSYTGKGTLKFYKNWEKQVELASTGAEIDHNKSVYWFKHIPYKNDGDVPSANGILLHTVRYLDTGGAHYKSAIIAIGILLENMFPNAAFLTVLWGEDYEEVEIVIEWLEYHFKKSFKKPIYFDRKQLLGLLKNEYDNKEALICRFAHLYRKRHKSNMQFAIQYIGYEATLSFYSKILADTGFGTYGFSDVLDPWISVTQDLEATLELINESKKWLLRDESDEYRIKEAANYDLAYILKKLLSNYILWTPVQREELNHFYTNKDSLEGKEEGIFEAINTIMGYRVDIAPICVDEQELFEAFMFHDPKNGHQYRQIIDEWKRENSEKYEKLKEKIELQIQELEGSLEEDGKGDKEVKDSTPNNEFLLNFAPHERYFVKKALDANPLFTEVEQAVKAFKNRVVKVTKEHSDQDYREKVKTLPKATNITYIKSRIKEIGYSVHPDFEEWLEAIENEEILFYLHFAMALKLYNRDDHFSRFSFLWNRNYWENWE